MNSHIIFINFILISNSIYCVRTQEIIENLYWWKNEILELIKNLEQDPIWTQNVGDTKPEDMSNLQTKLVNFNDKLHQKLSKVVYSDHYPYNDGKLDIMREFRKMFDSVLINFDIRSCWLFNRSPSGVILEPELAQLRSMIDALPIDLNTFVVQMDLAYTEEEFRKRMESLDHICTVEEFMKIVDKIDENPANLAKIRDELNQNKICQTYHMLSGQMLDKMMRKITKILYQMSHCSDCQNFVPTFLKSIMPFEKALNGLNLLKSRENQMSKVKFAKEIQQIWTILRVETDLEILKNQFEAKMQHIKLVDRADQVHMDGEGFLRYAEIFGTECKKIGALIDKLPTENRIELKQKMDELQKTTQKSAEIRKNAILSELEKLDAEIVNQFDKLRIMVEQKYKKASSILGQTLTQSALVEELNAFSAEVTDVYTKLDRHGHLGIKRLNLWEKVKSLNERMENLIKNRLAQGQDPIPADHLISIKRELIWHLDMLGEEVKRIGGETRKRIKEAFGGNCSN